MGEFDGYFEWLCFLVNADMERYSELLFQLHDTDFVWCLELDESRANDGLELRKEYYEMTGDDWVMLMEKPCSVLEMLVALARRMDDMLMDDNTASRVPVWFWEMVKNLGLKKYKNVVMLVGNDDDLYGIQTILHMWMTREFEFDGVGSVFPLQNPASDQRDATIVRQLNAYVLENYIED